MNDNYEGALFQDSTFEFTGLKGLKLEQLITCIDPKNEDLIMVYIKVETKKWHQFFLDAGYGFWQNYADIDPKEESKVDDAYSYSAKETEWGLVHKKIENIWCAPHYTNSQITIKFETQEKLVLRTIQPEVFDTPAELVFLRHHQE